LKRFLRTTAGKTVTFILCILCFCILAVSVVGAVIIAKNGMYTTSEQELEQEIIDSEIRGKARDLFQSTVRYTTEEGSSENEIAFSYGNVVPDKGNMIFRFTDEGGKEITVSEHAGEIENWEYTYPCIWFRDETGYSFFEFTDEYPVTDDINVILSVNMKQGFPENDSFRFLIKLLHFMFSLRYAVYVIGGLAFILMILCFIILMCVSARRPGTEELWPGPLNAVPFDLMLAVSIAAGAFLAFICSRFFNDEYFQGIRIADLFIIPVMAVYMTVLTGLSMSLAARIKQKKLFRNTVIFYLLKGLCFLVKALWAGIGKLPVIWKTVLAVLGVTAIDWIMMAVSGRSMRDYFFLSLAEKLIIIPIVLYIAWSMRRLQKSGEAMAKGNLDYQTDMKGLFWDFRKHGENLNQISGAMAAAVNERLKSERMKTELITNVSHDIKTPLTSIINYAGLIGQEPCENEKIKEYTEVLVRQSERLKRLIEDLVEASKASTGNLEVELVPCSANMLLSQAAGEYEEKLSALQLEMLVDQPEQELKIMADGRRMWRIFDNLMNNICKYALSGTRVYLSLEQSGENAVFTFRNTSREPLNITEEELMERFTRGDSSRHTEGNGLGLSIAKSLAQLQNGTIKIMIDADLFKAQLWFPIIY